MSYRIALSPLRTSIEADWEIAPDATRSQIRLLARHTAWSRPLKIYAATRDDPRIQQLLGALDAAAPGTWYAGDIGVYAPTASGALESLDIDTLDAERVGQQGVI